jgi:hypothetical protein
MALITDPDQLNQSTEIDIDTGALTITLNEAGNLSADGVTMQALYSFLKEEWRTDATLIPFPFPMVAITPEQFEFVDGWEPADNATRKLMRTGGWREIAANGDVKREYAGIISLGNIDAVSKTSGDKAYYAFANDTSGTEFTYAGPVNEAIQTFGDSSNGDFDSRSQVLTLFIRQQGKTYGSQSSTDIGVSGNLSYITYRFPLSEGTDLNISANDTTIATTAPYTGMSITYESSPQASDGLFTSDLQGGPYNFGIVIDGNNGTKQQIYEFVQWSLRQSSNIDADATGASKPGELQDALAQFVGSQLLTLEAANVDGGGTGVAITNFDTNDTNDLTFTDSTGTARNFPFVSAGTLNFNSNLVDDGSAVYRMFFTYTEQTAVADLAISSASGSTASIDSAGGNFPSLAEDDYIQITGASNAVNNGIWQVTDVSPSSSQFDATKVDGATVVNETAFSGNIRQNPFGSEGAVLVDDNAGTDISGTISGSSVAFDFDYDGNTQGGRTPATNATITIVAIGLNSAQYVLATGTITRATGLSFSLVSALERNYSNA